MPGTIACCSAEAHCYGGNRDGLLCAFELTSSDKHESLSVTAVNVVLQDLTPLSQEAGLPVDAALDDMLRHSG